MTKNEILTYGNPVLRNKAEVINSVDRDIMRIVHDMMDTLEEDEKGVGLAAPQIGISKRIMVINLTKYEEGKKFALINPKIIDHSFEEEEYEEGCLSVPDVWGNVSRPKTVRLKGTLPGGRTILIDADNYLARVLQHEMDHLEGRLFIDYLSAEDRLKNKDKIDAILERNRKLFGKVCL